MSETTKSWTVTSNTHGSPMSIRGASLIDAIERDWPIIDRQAGMLGGAPGYHLDEVIAEYRDGILGGKGGIEIRVTHRTLNMQADAPSGEPRVTKIWIHAAPADLPAPHTFSGPDPSPPSRPYAPEPYVPR